jgi:O-antigen/teichoic acid export membrane protein
LSSTQRSLLVRTINFRSLELRQLVAMAVAAPLALAVAVRGHGPWALVTLELTLTSVSTILLWFLSPWRPTAAYSWASLRDLGAFGGNVLGARLLADVTQTADKLLIGRFVGAASLGAYALSYNVVLSPFSRVVGPLQEVLFPAFSHMQEDSARMSSTWLRATRLVTALALPATLGLVAVAPDFVAVALGERWHAAAPIIQILAWVGLLQAVQGLNQTLLQAADRTSTLLRFSMIAVLVNVAAFALGLTWGAVGVAAAYAISSSVLFVLFTFITARVAGVSLLAFAQNLSGVVQASILMFVCVLTARAFLVHEAVPAGMRLCLAVIGGAAVFLAAAAWRAPEILSDLRSLRRPTRLEPPTLRVEDGRR